MTARPNRAPTHPDRRIDRARHSIEAALDDFFRPAHWAAALSYRLGLSGRIHASTLRVSTRHPSTPDRRPLRVAFASDFHAGTTTDRRLLADACDALTAFEPDVLLLGGDFVSVRASYVDELVPLLARVPAPLGKFGVLGNHDVRSDLPRVIASLERAGVRLLRNASARLAAPYDDVAICGLDDPTRGAPDAAAALDLAAGTRVVLMHSPDGLLALGDRPFDLALCGHTHGGQVALPWGAPIVVPAGRLSRRFCRGCFDAGGGRTLLVSRGVGCSALPVRLFAAPEVHLCLIT